MRGKLFDPRARRRAFPPVGGGSDQTTRRPRKRASARLGPPCPAG